MVSIFSVEACVVYKVDATSDDVTSSEGGSVGLAGAGGTKRVTVVAVVTVRVFVPAWNRSQKHIDIVAKMKIYF